MRYFLIILFLVCSSGFAFSQNGKKVQFVGGARSLNTLAELDSASIPKRSGGYALLDLGIKINPNSNTEVMGMFRINNEYGGFWGGGVNFDVRQLYVRGVANDIFRYQIGNIDYKLTPYTFYNHNQDILTSSIGTLGIREDVFNYETFYSNNTWRQQGASLNFGLEFPKVIKDIEVNSFISRINSSDFNFVLDRFFGGGNVVINKDDNLAIGLNHVSIFDLTGTAKTDNIYTNDVSSITFDYHLVKNKFVYGIDGEYGVSSVSQSESPEDSLTDYFLHARGYMNFNSGLKLSLGILDNGADYRSFGAQSRRVSFNQENNFFNRYVDLTDSTEVLRPVSLFDLYNDPELYDQGISVGLMENNPMISSVLPYGIASFNRQGGYFGIHYDDPKKLIDFNGRVYMLSESRGQGTLALKSFLMTEIVTTIHVEKIWDGKKEFHIQMSHNRQQTSREGEYDFESVDLTTNQINFGIELEVIDDIYLMGNCLKLKATGNDQMPIRNSDDEIINYENFSVDGEESLISSGLKISFSKQSYLAIIHDRFKYRFSQISHEYDFNQSSVVYVLKF